MLPTNACVLSVETWLSSGVSSWLQLRTILNNSDLTWLQSASKFPSKECTGRKKISFLSHLSLRRSVAILLSPGSISPSQPFWGSPTLSTQYLNNKNSSPISKSSVLTFPEVSILYWSAVSISYWQSSLSLHLVISFWKNSCICFGGTKKSNAHRRLSFPAVANNVVSFL